MLGDQFGATVSELRSHVSETEIGWGGFVYDFGDSG